MFKLLALLATIFLVAILSPLEAQMPSKSSRNGINPLPSSGFNWGVRIHRPIATLPRITYPIFNRATVAVRPLAAPTLVQARHTVNNQPSFSTNRVQSIPSAHMGAGRGAFGLGHGSRGPPRHLDRPPYYVPGRSRALRPTSRAARPY